MSDDLRKEGEEALLKLEREKRNIRREKRDLRREAREFREAKEAEAKKAETPLEAKARRVEAKQSDAEAIRAEKKARIAQILTRGILNEKFRVVYEACVPKGYAGKFVLDREEDVVRYSNLFFGFDYKKSGVEKHGSPDGRIRIGDVVLMTITQEDRELLREMKAERIKQKLGLARREFRQLSEEFAARGGPQAFDESDTQITRG